jgi:thymidine kinase
MAKLYFRYGVVGSSKTLNLLTTAYNYRKQGKNILLVKPALDTRFGKDTISSRAGLSEKADIVLEQHDSIFHYIINRVDCILVDEVNFITKQQVKELRHIASFRNTPVICYGLRTDYMGNLFDGSKELMCVADSIEEIKNTCWFCNKKAIMNLKYIDGVPIKEEGEQIELGCEEKYIPVCYLHYENTSNV